MKAIINWLGKHIADLLWVPLTSALLWLTHTSFGHFYAAMDAALTKEQIARCLVGVSIALMSLVFYVIYVCSRDTPEKRATSIRNRFRFDKQTGINIHKQTGDYCCTECLLSEPPLISYLHAQHTNGRWRCPARNCNGNFYDPKTDSTQTKPPEEPPALGLAHRW